MNGFPIGIIVVRNILPEDTTSEHITNVECYRQNIPLDQVTYGQLIATNPDFASYGLGKLLFSSLLLLTFKLKRKAVVTEIAHGLSNIAGRTLYEKFGFVAKPVEIGTAAGHGSTLVSLVTYIPRKIQQYNLLWKMTWCFKSKEETKTNINKILKEELEQKNLYRNSDVSKFFPNPQIHRFSTYLGLEFWKARVQMVELLFEDETLIGESKEIYEFLTDQKKQKDREEVDAKQKIVRTNSGCECNMISGKPVIHTTLRGHVLGSMSSRLGLGHKPGHGKWCYINSECVDADPYYCQYSSDAPYNYTIDEDLCWDWVDSISYKNYRKK